MKSTYRNVMMGEGGREVSIDERVLAEQHR